MHLTRDAKLRMIFRVPGRLRVVAQRGADPSASRSDSPWGECKRHGRLTSGWLRGQPWGMLTRDTSVLSGRAGLRGCRTRKHAFLVWEDSQVAGQRLRWIRAYFTSGLQDFIIALWPTLSRSTVPFEAGVENSRHLDKHTILSVVLAVVEA